VIRSEPRTNGHTSETVGLDPLTGVWNRTGFIAAATPVFVSCRRRNAPIALAYFDFQLTRDHADDASSVDRILLGMAELLRRTFRTSDVIGRVDRFRFAVLLSDCIDDALAAVDGVRGLTDATAPERLTLTAGMVRGTNHATLDDLMRATDAHIRSIMRAE